MFAKLRVPPPEPPGSSRRNQVPQHVEKIITHIENPNPRIPSSQILPMLHEDPSNPDSIRCTQQRSPFLGIHAKFEAWVRPCVCAAVFVVDVRHDRPGVSVKDGVAGYVAEIAGVVACFLLPECPGHVGPAVQRGYQAVHDILIRRKWLPGSQVSRLDPVHGTLAVVGDDGRECRDVVLCVRRPLLSWLPVLLHQFWPICHVGDLNARRT